MWTPSQWGPGQFCTGFSSLAGLGHSGLCSACLLQLLSSHFPWEWFLLPSIPGFLFLKSTVRFTLWIQMIRLGLTSHPFSLRNSILWFLRHQTGLISPLFSGCLLLNLFHTLIFPFSKRCCASVFYLVHFPTHIPSLVISSHVQSLSVSNSDVHHTCLLPRHFAWTLGPEIQLPLW